ncbi:LysR substrate-binding domain-containing protein [Phreatobacter sp. AB_2022a]|uniref:LysR substrate-binding domain-containing protein n=1 Tax=Phreatobacter sp. AB_2022a TaxID=3003134 RepID=UPI0022876E8A|nr:LysR substrate-binding domain-containing protein [Phreatobacter sp. AB_2022a]MCZ0735848.1 LysR substrate-binding domain-containing protein [Phreatobacter sp. AB_2022a]
MDTRHLEAFRAVIETGSMTAAAALTGKSQPAVSNLITRLEDELGLALFKRRKGKLEATPEAALFYEEARRSLGALERTMEVARDLKRVKSGTLALASQPGLATYVLPPIIAELLKRWPDGTVRFITRSSPTVRDLGRIDAFDIGFAELPIDSPAAIIEVFQIGCVAVLPARHPLGRHPVITPALLEGVPVISLYADHFLHEAIERAFAEAGVPLKMAAHVEFFGSACALVMENLGVTIVDAATGAHFDKLGLVIRPFEPELFYKFAMFRPTNRPLSRIATDFVAEFRRMSTARPG